MAQGHISLSQSCSIVNSSSFYYYGKIETILNYKCTFDLTEYKSTSVTHEQVQVSVNSTWYCSSIYRHMTQPVRNYSHALYIYY
jgi:hypothetical protein